MDLANARKLMTDEIKKPKEDQDRPLILKAQRATYKERRNFIETLKADGSISDIIGAHPILGISCYVSMAQRTTFTPFKI